MLYVVCGDRYQAREYCKELVSVCQKKRPHAEYITLSADQQPMTIEELLLGQGLFESKYIVFLDEILSHTTTSHLLTKTKEYNESPHVFIIFEPALDTKKEGTLKKAGAKIKRYKEKEISQESKKVFGFLDVFLRRKKIKTLAAFNKLIAEGESAELILQTLLWQLRTLNAVAKNSSATAAGVKPFPFQKAKKALTAFKSNEPLELFVKAEHIVRNGRVSGMTDEEIVEHIIVAC